MDRSYRLIVALLIWGSIWCLNRTANGQPANRPLPPGIGDPRLRNVPFGYVPKHLKSPRWKPQTYADGSQANMPSSEAGIEVRTAGFLDESEDDEVGTASNEFEDEVWDLVDDQEVNGREVPPGNADLPATLYDDEGFECPGDYGAPCWWLSGEYLLWWKSGMGTPPLATIGPNGGVLPGATIVFGDEGLNDSSSSGGRFTLGRWLGPEQRFGVDFTYLFLGEDSTSFAGDAAQFPFLARPFVNVNPAVLAPDVRLLNSAGVVQGRLDIVADTEFQTFEILFRHTSYRSCSARWDWLIGYRDAQLRDRLRIDEQTTALAAPNQGTTTSLLDQFEMENTFRGVELGVMGQAVISPCWSWDWTAKVALGNIETRAEIAGQTTTTPAAGAAVIANGGLFAQGTNSGVFVQDRFGTVTEFGLALRREMRCGWSASIGYSMVYVTNVWRAGEQIDTSVNTSQIPPGALNGDARPQFPAITSDFWAQGLRFGLARNF